jgi:hypothetical protein
MLNLFGYYTWYQSRSLYTGALKAYLELKCKISKKKNTLQFNEPVMNKEFFFMLG